MFTPTSRYPACQSGMVAPGIRHLNLLTWKLKTPVWFLEKLNLAGDSKEVHRPQSKSWNEIRSEHDEAANVAAYCLDFPCSDAGEPMASVLMSLEGLPSWSFMTGPDFYDETVNSIKYYGNKEHECVKKRLGGREVFIWRPDEVIDDVS